MERIILNEQSLDDLGNIFWNLRTARGVTQQLVAKGMGTKQSHVSSMESNKVIPLLPAIVKYLDNIGYQLEITPKNPSNIQS